jgi:hypothetical protein
MAMAPILHREFVRPLMGMAKAPPPPPPPTHTQCKQGKFLL